MAAVIGEEPMSPTRKSRQTPKRMATLDMPMNEPGLGFGGITPIPQAIESFPKPRLMDSLDLN